MEPSARIVCQRVLTTYGDGYEFEIGKALDNLHVALQGFDLAADIVNLSFGGYAFDDRMRFLAQAVRRIQRRGVVVVASAGNDATCRPTFPACLPGVIGVAALDRDGNAARFTNYGYWVRRVDARCRRRERVLRVGWTGDRASRGRYRPGRLHHPVGQMERDFLLRTSRGRHDRERWCCTAHLRRPRRTSCWQVPHRRLSSE